MHSSKLAAPTYLSELGLGKKDVTSDFRVVFHELKFLWQRSRIFPFHVEEARASCAEKLDQQRSSFLARCHQRSDETRKTYADGHLCLKTLG